MNSSQQITIELQEFVAANLEEPIAGETVMDCSLLWGRYSKARDDAEAAADFTLSRVYDVLAGVCSMTLSATDARKPFGPLASWATGSTPTSLNFRGRQSMVFGEVAKTTEHPALRARLADLAWVNGKNVDAARMAIDAYADSIDRVLLGKATMRSGGQQSSDYEVLDHLRRACVIQTQIGWKGPSADRLAALAKRIRMRARKRRDFFDLVEIANLELDFQITPPATLGKAAERLVPALNTGEPEDPERLWAFATRAYALAGQKADSNRAIVEVAECQVATADRHKKSPMHETHWLEQAIATLRRVRGTNARRAELQARLVKSQGSISDFMVPHVASVDISDAVNATRKHIGGRELVDALLVYAEQPQSPIIANLRQEALAGFNRTPFASMFAPIVYDAQGRPVSRIPSMSFGAAPEEANLRFEIIRSEDRRRGCEVAARIEPGRLQIMFDHAPDERVFTLLAHLSPLVPPHHEILFGKGLAHFFDANFIESAHLLIPQLENCLRFILANAGGDPNRIQTDMTQSSITLSTLLDEASGARKSLEEILTEDVVFEIENLFDHPAGPALRHRMAHGLLHQWAFLGHDVIYACWFLYRLCMWPLLDDGDEIRRRLPAT
jgi:hypothetical protein